mgnify:FL=1|jgi:hypothetical protein
MMQTEKLIELSKLRIDQQTSKLALAERVEQQLLVTHNGGLFKSSPELICFLTIWSEDTLFVPDVYNNPIKVNRLELLAECKAAYQAALIDWHCEYEKLKQQRRAGDI